MSNIRVITNSVPRDILDASELSPSERATFDYIDWARVDVGTESAHFFRYRGELYDLGEFTADAGITRGSGLPAHLSTWDGYLSESFFSAVVVRFVEQHERVVVGLVLS